MILSERESTCCRSIQENFSKKIKIGFHTSWIINFFIKHDIWHTQSVRVDKETSDVSPHSQTFKSIKDIRCNGFQTPPVFYLLVSVLCLTFPTTPVPSNSREATTSPRAYHRITGRSQLTNIERDSVFTSANSISRRNSSKDDWKPSRVREKRGNLTGTYYDLQILSVKPACDVFDEWIVLFCDRGPGIRRDFNVGSRQKPLVSCH